MVSAMELFARMMEWNWVGWNRGRKLLEMKLRGDQEGKEHGEDESQFEEIR